MVNEHVCRNCSNSFQGKFCNNCGEKVYDEKSKKIIHFLSDGLHFITHFEGTFLRTLKTILSQPGKLSLDYCEGIHKRYFRPQSFFLLLVIIYLIFPFFEGLNMKMYYYVQNDLFGDYALRKIKEIMLETNLSEKQLSEIFQQRSEKVSKFLLYIIIPFSALFFWACFYRKRKYFYDHMVFAAEVNSIYLLWGFLIVPFLTYICYRLFGYLSFLNDNFFGPFNSAILFIYVFISLKRFYYLKGWQSFLFTLLFLFFHMFIVHFLYKMLLFVIVINQIH